MKRFPILFLLLFCCFIKFGFSQCPIYPYDLNWEIVFEDDFSFFNTNRWTKIYGNHGIEPQHYTPNNVEILNGELVILTKEEYFLCTDVNCNCNKTYNYTSGLIRSKYPIYKYGYYEILAKLPGSPGYWPAFWL